MLKRRKNKAVLLGGGVLLRMARGEGGPVMSWGSSSIPFWLVQVVCFSRPQAEAVDAPVCRVSLVTKTHGY